MTPKTQKQWTVAGKSGFEDLKFTKDAPIPEIGDKDVLVKCIVHRLSHTQRQITC